LTIHLENCSIYTKEATEIYITKHDIIGLKYPRYSPDLAPSDFYLFLIIKERLKDIQMVDEEDISVQCLVRELLNGIPRRELAKILGTWINCLMTVS
jgi:hypothetical protein